MKQYFSLAVVATLFASCTNEYFTVYVLGSDTETQHDFVVSAYGEDGSVLNSRTFTSVPIRNNYVNHPQAKDLWACKSPG